MEVFKNSVKSTVRRAWGQFRYAYERTGYDQEDINMIAQVHLVSYLGLFSLGEHPERAAAFAKVFERKNGREPSEQDIIEKDRTNCSCFLYQRLAEAAETCSKKNKNIRGVAGSKTSFLAPNMIDASKEAILEDPKRYGLIKLTKKKAAAMKKRATERFDNGYISDGQIVIVVDIPAKPIDEQDTTELFYTAENSLFLMNPLEALESIIEKENDVKIKRSFDNLQPEVKKDILLKFVKDFKKDPRYTIEVSAAKEILANFEAI
jgi:hypothetical protein